MDTGKKEFHDPWILRRLPSVLVAIVTISLGIAMLVVSERLNAKHPWASSLLINLGTSIVLLSPLLLLTSVSGRVLVRRQRARDERIDRVEVEIADVRRTVDEVLAEISDRVVQSLASDRAAETELIADVIAAPTAAVVAAAVRLGERQRFVSTRGPRVGLFDTSAFARFAPQGDEQSAVEVVIERRDGTEIGRVSWTPRQSAADLGHSVGQILQERGLYPGDIAFDFGRVFKDLHELLDLGYRSATGAGGVVNARGRIIQLTGDNWILTDTAITTRDLLSQYRITLDRLDELDWDSHLRGRRDIDIGGFRQAFDTAVEMMQAGTLIPPEPTNHTGGTDT